MNNVIILIIVIFLAGVFDWLFVKRQNQGDLPDDVRGVFDRAMAMKQDEALLKLRYDIISSFLSWLGSMDSAFKDLLTKPDLCIKNRFNNEQISCILMIRNSLFLFIFDLIMLRKLIDAAEIRKLFPTALDVHFSCHPALKSKVNVKSYVNELLEQTGFYGSYVSAIRELMKENDGGDLGSFFALIAGQALNKFFPKYFPEPLIGLVDTSFLFSYDALDTLGIALELVDNYQKQSCEISKSL